MTAQPGTPPDGRLGLREPRTERLAVLYEEKGGKISRMWLRQDTETLASELSLVGKALPVKSSRGEV